MNSIKIFFAMILAALLLIHSPAFAASLDAEKTGMDLNASEKGLERMYGAGLPVTRYNDTLLLAKQIYEAQVALEAAKGRADFSLVQDKIKEMKSLEQNAYKASDELKALEITISQTTGVDLSSVIEIYGQAKSEFNAERYEESIKLTDTAYKKISELEAVETKVKAIYDASSRGIAGFFRQHWKGILAGILAFAAIFALAYSKVACWRIKRKIISLEMRKDSIKSLISKTQRAYFEEGKSSEVAYYVRTKKYGELIRDINRQIPLLKEELAKKEKRKI